MELLKRAAGNRERSPFQLESSTCRAGRVPFETTNARREFAIEQLRNLVDLHVGAEICAEFPSLFFYARLRFCGTRAISHEKK